MCARTTERNGKKPNLKGKRPGLPGIPKYTLMRTSFVLFPDATDRSEHPEAGIDALECGELTNRILKLLQ
jgi:hypothetical protein